MSKAIRESMSSFKEELLSITAAVDRLDAYHADEVQEIRRLVHNIAGRFYKLEDLYLAERDSQSVQPVKTTEEEGT